ncbi:MAG: FkbM family methyltransferase [Syntrophales bacterium]
MFTRMSFINRKRRDRAWNLFNKIEKNRLGEFEENGEKRFVENILEEFEKTDAERVIFDVGANVGQYSTMLTSVAAARNIRIKLHLFEPAKPCFAELTNRFSQSDNLILNNFGASDSNGTARIFYDEEKSEGASLYQRNLHYYNTEMNKFAEIELRRLDDYIKDKKINHIAFIKLDIEGHELNAFKGLGEYLNHDFIDFLQFEYGGTNLDSHTSLMELYQFLTNRGFLVAKVMPTGLEIRSYSPFMENFQNANYMAVSPTKIKK